MSVNHLCTCNRQQTVDRNIYQPFVHKRTANGRPKYISTVCAQTDSKPSTEIYINRLCTNGQQTVDRNIRPPFVNTCSQTICAQMFQCTNSAQEHSLTNISANRLRTNGQQTVDRNIRQPFDLCNGLLCRGRLCLYFADTNAHIAIFFKTP